MDTKSQLRELKRCWNMPRDRLGCASLIQNQRQSIKGLRARFVLQNFRGNYHLAKKSGNFGLR